MGFGFRLSLIFWTWFGVTANTYDFELEDRWSQEVLLEGLCRYGNRVECCWGWRPIDWGRCEPSCHQECKHGQCVSPDRCQCHPGYTGKTCNQDLNECGLSPRPCKHRCVNTHGSFKCYCPTGYTELPDGGCQNARTCALANCQYGCEVTKGVVRCTCPSPGLRLGPDRRTCVDINECVSGGGVCPRRRKCVNTFSSFLCKCHQGFRLRYINGRYTCIDKDTRPFCTLNPGSPKCQCRDGSCKAVLKVTLEPARHRTTTPAPRGTTVPTVKPITRPFTKPLPRKTTTTTTVTTTTSGTASVPATTSSMATTFLTTTISPTTAEITTELTTTTIPTTTPPKPTTPTTQKTTTTSPTTAPETPLIPTTPQPTTTTTQRTTTTTTQKTTTTSPTTAPETTSLKPTTPQPTTTTTQRTTTTTTQRTTTTIQTTEFIPTTSEPTTMPIPTTTTVALTTSPTPTTTVAVMTTLVTTVPPPTTSETTTTTTTTTASTVAVTTPSTTTLDNRIQKEVTRKRGDVHIPRQPDQNQVWEFDIELGNTAEDDFGDDPAAGVLHCSFEQGVCSWISDQDGDLPWNTVHHHSTGGSYLTVPELKAGQRSTRGARLVVPVLPPWNHGDLCFSFSHWLTGHHVGLLQVFVKKRGRGQRYSPALWSRTGGHGWRHTHISLRGEEVDRVLLKGERRRGEKGEVAVDDVTLRRGPCPHGNTIRRH